MQVRTTISLKKSLLSKLKLRANAENRSISDCMNEILAVFFLPKKETGFKFQWTSVEGSAPPSIDVADRDQTHQFLDENK